MAPTDRNVLMPVSEAVVSCGITVVARQLAGYLPVARILVSVPGRPVSIWSWRRVWGLRLRRRDVRRVLRRHVLRILLRILLLTVWPARALVS
jgi:hypothetical protein